MKYLNNSIKTLEELKKAYRQWAMKLHPDVGGSDEEMKILNAEYETIFAKVKTIHINKDGQEYRKETTEVPSDFVKIINELLKLKNIHIEIIGSFIWINGATKPYKKILKSLGMKWHSKKECWYLPPIGYNKHSGKEYTMNEIRMMYGVLFDEETSHEEIRRKELQRA